MGLFLSAPSEAAPLHDGEHRAVLNGINHWYRVAASKRRTTPLIIVHGGPGGSVYTFERTLGPRLERFSTIVYYDQRGSGRSEAPADATNYSIEALVQDLDALRQSLGADRINLLGFSFGGQLALEYAVRHPDRVEGMILQAAPNGDLRRLAAIQTWGFASVLKGDAAKKLEALQSEPILSPSKRMEEVWSLADADAVDRFLFHDPKHAARNRTLWEQSGHRNSGLMLKALFADTAPGSTMRFKLRQLNVPALIIVGRYDRNVGLDMERDLASALPNSRLVIMPNSAHFPDLEEPESYACEVKRFLTQRQNRCSAGRAISAWPISTKPG
jgi:proline iminopeptidase